jgi:peptide/nickel transport system substrate-binding protein
MTTTTPPPILPRRVLIAGAAALPLMPRAHAQAPARRPAGRKGQIVVGLYQEPTRFHPLQARIEVDDGVQFNIFSALWSITPEGEFMPDLAAEIPSLENGGLSADGLTWRIRLRPGVRWHDGAPFTAEDVKFTLELLQKPDFPAMSRNGHSLVRDIQVVSPTEITWRMESFFAPYLSILAWTLMVPRHVLADVADLRHPEFTARPIGTGPFKWGDRRPGERITLIANENYHGEGPFVERVIFRYIPDMNGLKTQFITGAVDAVSGGLSPDHVEEVRGRRNLILYVAPSAYLTSFTLNNGLPQFQDPAVRQALYLAMDRQAIIRNLFYGRDEPTESFLPKQSWAYNDGLPRHRHDVAAAKRLLDEAGWKPGTGGIREKNGVRLAFSTSTVAGNHLREQAQQFLQQCWQPLGISMTIRNFPAAVMWGDFWRKSQFESTIVGAIFPTGADPDVSDRLGSWAIPAQSGSGANTMQYSNPEVDRLLRESVGLLDRERRKANYFRVQELVRQDLPMLPICQTNQIEGSKSDLLGYRANINYRSNCWNLRQWYWAS